MDHKESSSGRSGKVEVKTKNEKRSSPHLFLAGKLGKLSQIRKIFRVGKGYKKN